MKGETQKRSLHSEGQSKFWAFWIIYFSFSQKSLRTGPSMNCVRWTLVILPDTKIIFTHLHWNCKIDTVTSFAGKQNQWSSQRKLFRSNFACC